MTPIETATLVTSLVVVAVGAPVTFFHRAIAKAARALARSVPREARRVGGNEGEPPGASHAPERLQEAGRGVVVEERRELDVAVHDGFGAVAALAHDRLCALAALRGRRDEPRP